MNDAPQVDDIYTKPDGARIRVDRVADGHVYYVAWRAGREIGNPLRMPISDWKFLMGMEGMVLAHSSEEATRRGENP